MSEWVAQSVARIDPATRLFVVDHLDEILGETPDGGFDIQASLEVLSSCDRRLPSGMEARLALPWGDSVTLETELPSLDRVPVLDPYEPRRTTEKSIGARMTETRGEMPTRSSMCAVVRLESEISIGSSRERSGCAREKHTEPRDREVIRRHGSRRPGSGTDPRR